MDFSVIVLPDSAEALVKSVEVRKSTSFSLPNFWVYYSQNCENRTVLLLQLKVWESFTLLIHCKHALCLEELYQPGYSCL